MGSPCFHHQISLVRAGPRRTLSSRKHMTCRGLSQSENGIYHDITRKWAISTEKIHDDIVVYPIYQPWMRYKPWISSLYPMVYPIPWMINLHKPWDGLVFPPIFQQFSAAMAGLAPTSSCQCRSSAERSWSHVVWVNRFPIDSPLG